MRGAILAVTLGLLVIAGCGRDDDRRQVRAVAEALYTAVQDGDGAEACARLSVAAASALEREERRPCPEAMTEVELTGARVTAVRIFETGAAAKFDTGNTAFLDRMDEGWRVSAAGCVVRGETPAICELED